MPASARKAFRQVLQGAGHTYLQKQLERFEELGIFQPVARVRYPKDEGEHPKTRLKFEEVDGRRVYRGRLEEGEEWDGGIEDRPIGFSFEKEYVYRFLEARLLWEPASCPFKPWEALANESAEVRSYYSIFQVYALSNLVTSTIMLVRAEDYFDYNEEERIIEFLDQRPSVVERKDAVTLRRAQGRLEFDAVSFRYPETDREALSKISFGIGPGEVLALVGPSGAGKSTIAKLLLRFYDPNAGEIRLDGYDMRDLSLHPPR